MILMFADTETTSLHFHKGDRMIELAMVSYNTATGASRQLVRRYNPAGRKINAKAQAVHGISAEDLEVELEFCEKDAKQLNSILKATDVLIGHNIIGFDLDFIYGEIGNFIPDDQLSDCEVFDTQYLRWAAFEGKQPSLKEFVECCGVEYDESKAHAAIYDVEIMKEAFLIAWQRGWLHKFGYVDQPQLPEWA